MEKVIIEFDSKEIREIFLSWFSDGGGESGLYESAEIDGHQINVDYSRAFPAWGYDPKKHGDPIITVVLD